jgi:hypothetical protein
MNTTHENPKPPSSVAAGSEPDQAADAWSEVGRKAANLAMAATQEGQHGTCSEHRKTAQMAFDMELRLRQIPNTELRHGAKTPDV